MKTVRAKALREKTDQELVDQTRVTRKDLFERTVRGASGEAVKPHEKRQGHRLIARIRTILRERALRKALAGQMAQLEPQAQGATGVAARWLKTPPRPHLPRVKAPPGLPPAGRAACRLAEARRLSAGLRREDPGASQ